MRNRFKKMLGCGWKLPCQQQGCCWRQSEQWERGSQQLYAAMAAHTSRVTIPQQYSVLQVLGTTELSSTSKPVFVSSPSWSTLRRSRSTLGSHACTLLKARGKQLGLAALQRAGGDTHRAVPCQEGKQELLSVSPSPPLHGWGTLRQGLSLPLRAALSPCTAALPAPDSSLLSSAVSGSSRQAIKQTVKSSLQAATMSEEIFETSEAEVCVMADLL